MALPAVGWLWPSDNYEIFRADFVDYAKGSKAVKALLEKEGRPATPGSNRFLDLQVSLAPFPVKRLSKKWCPNTLSKLPNLEPLRLSMTIVIVFSNC